jgi:hypothetical protein
MNIESENFTIKLTHGELWSIAWDIKRSLLHDVANHWVRHQSSFERDESNKIGMIRQMYYALGRPDMYDAVMAEAKKIIEEYNKNQQK